MDTRHVTTSKGTPQTQQKILTSQHCTSCKCGPKGPTSCYFGAALAPREDPGGIICFGARVEGSLKCCSCSPPPHCGLALARQPEQNWRVYLFPFHSGTDELGAYWMTYRAHVMHSWVACCSIVWHMRCENCRLFGQYCIFITGECTSGNNQ